jgi:hypothetical protein
MVRYAHLMSDQRPCRHRLARAWQVISHNPLWSALIAALVAAAIIAHSGGVFSGSRGSSSPSHGAQQPSGTTSPLRAVVTPTAPERYAVVFGQDIDLPSHSEQWESLHNRGGIDAGASVFRLTLANRSTAPLTITNVEAVIRAARATPTGTSAQVAVQGEEVIRAFGVMLESEVVGARAPLRRVGSEAPNYFASHNIGLAPNEIYEAKVTVVTFLDKELEYAFVVTGNTAHGGLTEYSSVFRIVGAFHKPHAYRHEYLMLPERSGRRCWVLATYTSIPRCPR